MNKSTISILTAAGIATAVFATPLSAEPVFPPAHLNHRASFAAGVPSSVEIGDAWYHGGESGARAARVAADVHQASPYPTAYYFHLVRNYANDESAELRRFERTRRQADGRIADVEKAGDDAS